MDAAVFSSYPCSGNEFRTDTHEPGIGVVVGSTCFSAEVSIRRTADITPKTLRSTTRLTHTSHQQLLHEECALVWNGLLFVSRSSIHFLSVLVEDSRHKLRCNMLTIVGNTAIGIYHILELHVGRAESQCRSIVKLVGNTHLMCGVYDILYTHFLTETHGYGVDTLGKGTLQRYRVARESAVGICRRPDGVLMLHLVVDLHADIFVATFVARGKSLVHGLGIDKKLESGTRLAVSSNLVILPCVEVYVSDPCLDGTRLRFHSDEGTMHELNHIANGVSHAHLFLYRALLIVEELDHVRLVYIILYGVGTVWETCQQLLIARLLLQYALYEAWNDVAFLIAPRVLSAPVTVEVLLHLSHLLCHGVFGIFLHTGVDSCIDFQSAAIQVIAVLVKELLYLRIIGNSLTEVFCLSVIVFLHFIVEFYRLLA